MKINKFFIAGIIFYLLPAIPFIAYMIAYKFADENPMQIWYTFLISIVPSTLIGLILYIIGLAQKDKTQKEKVIGRIGLGYGIIALILSFIASWLLLMVLESF